MACQMRIAFICVLLITLARIGCSGDRMQQCAEEWEWKKARFTAIRDARLKLECRRYFKETYDKWNPEWICEDMRRLPLHIQPDGPRWMCGMDVFEKRKRPVLIYSMGCDGDINWEKDIRRRLPSAEMHIFDPTGRGRWLTDVLAELKPLNISLHEWWVYPPAMTDTIGDTPVMTIPAIMNKLGHTGRTIDLLKVDIEGSEWGQFTSHLAAGHFRFHHMNIELHGTTCLQHERFFTALDNMGYLVAFKETNHWGCDGWKCVEYTVVSRDHACATFAAGRHCPACREWNPLPQSELAINVTLKRKETSWVTGFSSLFQRRRVRPDLLSETMHSRPHPASSLSP